MTSSVAKDGVSLLLNLTDPCGFCGSRQQEAGPAAKQKRRQPMSLQLQMQIWHSEGISETGCASLCVCVSVCVTDDGVGWLASLSTRRCLVMTSMSDGCWGSGLYRAAWKGLRGLLC